MSHDLASVLASLSTSGQRLDTGLALRITTGNGMTVLGCSRVDEAPTDVEMEQVQEAVYNVFSPSLLFQSENADCVRSQSVKHYIRRLYWPLEDVGLVAAPLPLQQQSLAL